MRRSNTQRQRGMRTIACAVLGGCLLVNSIAPALARDAWRSRVVELDSSSFPTRPPPSHAPSRSNDDAWMTPTIIVGAGVAACMLLGCFDGSDEPAAASGASEPYYSSNRSREETVDRPDTSIGCAWGDRAYDTCH